MQKLNLLQNQPPSDVEQAVHIQEEDNIPPSGEEKQQEIQGFSALIKERQTSANGLNYDTTRGSRRVSSGSLVAIMNQKIMDNDISDTQAKQEKNKELEVLKLELESRMRREREEMESRMKEELEARVRQEREEMEAKVEAMVNILLEGKAKHGMMNQPTPGKFSPLETYNSSSNNKNDNQFPVTYCHQQGCLIVSPSHLCFLSDDGCISMDWEWNSLGRITTNRIMRIQRPDGKKISLLFEFESQVALLAAAAQFRRHISKARAATTGSTETPRRSSDSEYAMERKGLLQRGTDVKYSAMSLDQSVMSLDRYPSDHTPNDSEVVCLLHQNNNNVACLLRRLEKLEEMEASRDARAEEIVREILEKERAGGTGNSPNPPVPPPEGAESPRSNGAYNDTVTRQEVMEMLNEMFEMFDRRLKEIEKHVGIDASFCLLPWRAIGKQGSAQEDEEMGGQLKTFKLSKDVYSILATWNWKSKPFWMSMVVVFGFQMTLLILLLIDTLADPEHPLNLPVNVEEEVHIAQGLAVIVAVISQDDLRVGIEGFFQGVPDSFRGHRRFKTISNLQWRMANLIRFLQGFMSMFTSFILLMQADTIIELLLNFLGVAFISDLDDRFFALGALGYLGNANLRCTQQISRAEFYRDSKKHPTGKRCTPSWFRKNMHVLGVFAVVIAMLGCYLNFTFEQAGGNYSVDSFLVEFGDLTVPSLGLFNGCYNADHSGHRDSAGRVVYSVFSKAGSNSKGGTFAFCSAMKRWTFYDSSIGDKCHHYIVKSDVTRTFDVLEAGNLKWYTEKDEPLEFLKLTQVIQCFEDGERASWTGTTDECNQLELDGTLHESRSRHYEMVQVPQNTGVHDSTLSHAIYMGETSLEVVLFTGRRWVITDAEKLSKSANRNITNASDVKNFFITNRFRARNQVKNWILFISEEVSLVNDQRTPLGLRWYNPRYRKDYGYNFSSADLSRPVDAIFACARCDNKLNPCNYGGTCQTNGKCKCANGASGELQLCRKEPLGNGECNPYFNTPTFDYDGGDCCGSTCEGGLCGTTSESGFKPFGLENVTVDPYVVDAYSWEYETNMGIIASSSYVKRFDCQDPTMATFTIEVTNIENRKSHDPSDPTVGCIFGSMSVRCDGKLYLQTPALLFPDGYHCDQSYKESVHVPHGTSCELTLVNPPETAHYGYDYGVALYYGNSTNSTLIHWQEQSAGGEVSWDVPSSQCLTEVLSTSTVDIFNGSTVQGAAINHLSADGLSDYQCTINTDLAKERYFLTLLAQSVSFQSMAWGLHQCQGWGFPAVRIECNENNLITSLSTSRTQEKPAGGTLPTEISFLSSLEILDLANINLNGAIPSELGRLTALTELFLDTNDLNGTIPKELGRLTALDDLQLRHNGFNGPFPSQLGELKALTRLTLRDNDLSGPVPSDLGKLTSLDYLDLDLNHFNGQIPSELGVLTSLSLLDLASNDLSGPIPKELGMLQELDILSLHTNSLNSSIPSQLGHLSMLNLLLLFENELTGRIPSDLGRLQELEVLTLHKNSLTGSVPQQLGNLTALHELSLSLNDLSGPFPGELGNLPGWPGQFPDHANGSNSVTINVRTDEYPGETSFTWSKRNDLGLWQVLDVEDPANGTRVHNYRKEVEPDSLYRLEIFDSYGDGVFSGWFTITNSTPSQEFDEGTLMWEALGSSLEDKLVAFILVDSRGHADFVDCIPGEGCA